MTETKKQLIDLLHATLVKVEGLPERIANENMYLEDGIHVDIEFMTAILEYIKEATAAGNAVMKALQQLLGIEEGPKSANKSSNEGKSWSPEQILQHCRFEDNILYLPNVQFNKKAYISVKQWITEAGGKWTGGKVQGFTFDFDATRIAGILLEGKKCNLQQEYQFFETPDELADWLVSLIDLNADHAILEPSAGRGAIIRAIQKACPGATIDAFELMPENKQFLQKLKGIQIVGEDFTKGVPRIYDRICANPPFAKNQDIKHVRAMYEALNPNGGQMSVITSNHWCESEEKICVEFREWLADVGAEIFDIPSGTFKQSGTTVTTTAIVIKRL